jgi:acetate kinase
MVCSPKRRFTQDLQGATSQKTAFFKNKVTHNLQKYEYQGSQIDGLAFEAGTGQQAQTLKMMMMMILQGSS